MCNLRSDEWPSFAHAVFFVRRQVLVLPVIFILYKVIKEAGPGLCVIIVTEIIPDCLREVQEHVPRILGNAPDVRVSLKEEQPPLEYGRLVLGEDEPPQTDGHVYR